jgi:hypothetical protein
MTLTPFRLKMRVPKFTIQAMVLVALLLLNRTGFAPEPIQDIHVGDEVQVTCNNPLTVLGKARVISVTADQITVKSKGESYNFYLTNITINGKTYAKSALLIASTRPDTAFAKLLELMENPAPTLPPDLKYGKPIPSVSYYPISGGRQILPYKNPDDHHPTLSEVVRFVKGTRISEKLYLPDEYVCGNFAHDLIKSAEKASLACTLASIEFKGETIGHAVVAFRTTDFGLVFIDCTGGKVPGKPGIYNTIGYIKPGKTYGRLPLEIGRVDPNHYEFYELAKAAIDGVDFDSIAQGDINAQKKAAADELKSLKKYARTVSNDKDPILNGKIEHYRQQVRNLKNNLAALELKNLLREDPYMDYEKVVTAITLW